MCSCLLFTSSDLDNSPSDLFPYLFLVKLIMWISPTAISRRPASLWWHGRQQLWFSDASTWLDRWFPVWYLQADFQQRFWGTDSRRRRYSIGSYSRSWFHYFEWSLVSWWAWPQGSTIINKKGNGILVRRHVNRCISNCELVGSKLWDMLLTQISKYMINDWRFLYKVRRVNFAVILMLLFDERCLEKAKVQPSSPPRAQLAFSDPIGWLNIARGCLGDVKLHPRHLSCQLFRISGFNRRIFLFEDRESTFQIPLQRCKYH